MPYKNKEQQREYQRIWAKKKRAGLPTSSRIVMTEEEYKEARRETQRKIRKPIYQKRDEMWGIKCWICGRQRKVLHLHRKDGKSHPCTIQQLKKALKEPEEWVRLCGWCHTGVHFCMNRFGWDWETVVKHLKERPSELHTL